MVIHFRNILIFILLSIFLSVNYCEAQGREYIAIIPPFHSRHALSNIENVLKLDHLRLVVFLYPDAAAVYSESDFINQTDDSLDQEIALPSTNHDENGEEPGGRLSNGILSVQLWIQGERRDPQFIQDSNEEWYTIQTTFAPHEIVKVKALFWVETSLINIDSLAAADTVIIANGKRGFLIDLAHASTWNDNIQSIETYVILKNEIQTTNQTFSANPPTYELQDSTLTWAMDNLEPSENDNIEVLYESNSSDSFKNTMTKLSAFIVKDVYDQLLGYVYQMDKQ